MNEERGIFDTIERYHQGLLSDEEKALFEKKIQNDNALAEYVKTSSMVNTLVHAAGLDLLREQMTKDLSELDKIRAKTKWKVAAGIAAIFIMIACLIYFIKGADQNTGTPNAPEKQNPLPKTEATRIIESKPKEVHQKTKVKNTYLIKPSKNQTDSVNTADQVNPFVPSLKKIDSLQTIQVIPKEKQSLPVQDQTTKEPHEKDCILSFQVIIHAACRGEMNGSVEVDQQNIFGAKKPYFFRISDSKRESTTGSFSDLGKGSYTITMYDSKGCSHSKEVSIPDKNCIVKKSYSFNPDYEGSWKIPYAEGESGSYTIYNKAGIIIFKGNFGENNLTEWSGSNLQGVTVEAGLYQCILQYVNGKTEAIEITIIR